MNSTEKKFNELTELAFNKLKKEYASKIKTGDPLRDMPHNLELHSKILESTSDMVAEIANSLYNDSEKDKALNLCRNKVRSFLPEIKKLIGL